MIRSDQIADLKGRDIKVINTLYLPTVLAHEYRDFFLEGELLDELGDVGIEEQGAGR